MSAQVADTQTPASNGAGGPLYCSEMPLLSRDPALLEAFRRGERRALHQIYQHYAEKVVALLRSGFTFESQGRTLRFSGFASALEIEDYVQEIFLKAFSERSRANYDGVRPFTPYLLRIARNYVLDELRSLHTSVDRFATPIDDTEPAADDSPGADTQLDVQRARATIAAFVASRPELEQRYIRARFLGDRSLLAAARELDISRTRARLLERKIIKALRRHLSRVGESVADVLMLGASK